MKPLEAHTRLLEAARSPHTAARSRSQGAELTGSPQDEDAAGAGAPEMGAGAGVGAGVRRLDANANPLRLFFE